jgi:hypothetical protein
VAGRDISRHAAHDVVGERFICAMMPTGSSSRVAKEGSLQSSAWRLLVSRPARFVRSIIHCWRSTIRRVSNTCRFAFSNRFSVSNRFLSPCKFEIKRGPFRFPKRGH